MNAVLPARIRRTADEHYVLIDVIAFYRDIETRRAKRNLLRILTKYPDLPTGNDVLLTAIVNPHGTQRENHLTYKVYRFEAMIKVLTYMPTMSGFVAACADLTCRTLDVMQARARLESMTTELLATAQKREDMLLRVIETQRRQLLDLRPAPGGALALPPRRPLDREHVCPPAAHRRRTEVIEHGCHGPAVVRRSGDVEAD